jgi:RNA polymerase sigma factor (sigma-70 family)
MTLLQESPELLASFRRGDRETLATVYRVYSVRVERYLKMLGRQSPQLPCLAGTADLHQDTFERAFSVRARNAYDATKEFRPYLMTIARNCFVNAVRRGHRELLNVEMAAVENIEEPQRQESFGDPHVTRLLDAYVRGLPDALRATFEQRFVFGHSQEVASSELGCTRRNLRTREEYLKRSLRRTLQAEGVLRGDCW